MWFMRLMTLGNIEGFAIGAFMAIGRRDARFTKIFTLLYRIAVTIGPFIVLGFAVTTYAYGYLRVRNNPYYMLFFDWIVFIPLWALFYSSMLSNRFTRLLEIKPLPLIGKISYGVYVWHLIVSLFVRKFFSIFLGISLPEKYSFISLLIFVTATLIVAIISWKIIESPFNRLKDKMLL